MGGRAVVEEVHVVGFESCKGNNRRREKGEGRKGEGRREKG